MKAQKHVEKMKRELEKLHLEGHIDETARYVAANDLSKALQALEDAIKQNMRE